MNVNLTRPNLTLILGSAILIGLLYVFWFYAISNADGAPGLPDLHVNADRALVIGTPVVNHNLAPLSRQMTEWAGQSSEPIDLIINSPGGDVVDGFLFISTMEAVRAGGVRIRCFVPHLAASMAFSILTHCSERYVLTHSFLLWHRVRVQLGGLFGSPVTAPEADILAEELQAMDDVVLSETVAAMPDADPEVVEHHFEIETLHVGVNLHRLSPTFCTPLQSIPGLLEALTDEKILHTKMPGLILQKPNALIYIMPGVNLYPQQQPITGGGK